jgi:putative ATPase
LPGSLAGRRYYHPSDQGFEARLRARMDEIRKLKLRGTEKVKSDE